MKTRLSILKNANIAIAVVILAILILIPLAMMFLRAFMVDGSFELLAPIRVISESNIGEIFYNSMLLSTLVVLVTTVFAAPLAYLTVKTELRNHRWIDVLLLVPFMTPPYIATMGWILFFQDRGIVDQFLPWLSFLRPYFFSLAGMVLVMSLNLFPFIYLIIKNNLAEINRSLEDAGAIHGGNFKYRLRKILIPLLTSGYLMGALLIFVKTLSEFGTPATLGRRVGFYVFTTEIYQYTNQWPIDFAKGTSLASILLITSMLIWYVQKILTARYDYKIVGGKDQGKKAYPLGKFQYLGWLYLALLLLLSIGVPYFTIISTSLMELWGDGITWSNLTFGNFREIFSSGSTGNAALWNSLSLSFIAATVAMFLGTFLAVTIVRSKGFFKGFIDASSLLSNTVPRIVIIVGLILFWNAPWMKVTVYNTTMMLALTYAIAFLPYTVQYVKSSYQQIDDSLFHAAKVSGASSSYTTRRILFPLIRPGMVAGWMMTFIISIRELVSSLMIRPAGTETSATYIYRQFDQGLVPLGMAMAVITVGLTTIVLILIQVYQNKDVVK